MRKLRFILPVFLAALFAFCSFAWAALPSPFSVIAGTTSDTANIDSSVVNGSYTNVPALGIKINEFSGGTGDTIYSIMVHSQNDRHYSISAIKLWKDKGSAGFSASQDSLMATLPVNGPFHENDSVKFSGINLIMADGQSATLYFTFNMNPDSVTLWSVYNNFFCGLKVHPLGIEMKNAGYGPAAGDTLQYPSPRRIRIDTWPPEFEDLYFALYDELECGGFNGIVDLGDSIRVAANITGGDVKVSAGVKADFSTFKNTGAPPRWQTLTDSIVSSPAGDSNFVSRWRIPLGPVATPLDVLSGFYYIVFTCQDTVGNSNRDSLLIMYPIDTERPLFDSVKVVLYWDRQSDGVISIGDTLQFWAWMESNEFFEVESVWVELDSIVSGWMVALEDTAGERIWQMKDTVVAGLIDTADGEIACWFHALDNACNTDSMRHLIDYLIDIEPPSISASDIILERWADVDSNNVMNIGDSIIIRVNANNVLDPATTCPVMVNLLETTCGFEGPWNYCMEESTASPGTGIYRLLWELGDEPQDSAVDYNANVAYVNITLEDDAGNKSVISSNTLAWKVDTKRPVPVGGLTATPMKDCVVDLTWTTQDSDLSGGGWFAIFSDWGTGGPINYDDTMGTTNDITNKRWTTDGTVVLDDSTTYKFVVQTIDNANNWEKPADTIAVSAHADCKPPVVCVTYPDPGLSWGPHWKLHLIAETEHADVCSSLVLYRQKDTDGMGTPGEWKRYGKMRQVPPYAGTYVFKDTIHSLSTEGLHEMIIYAYDCPGNVLDTMAAYDSCHFEFYWYSTSPTLFIASINDTVSPQSSCGYNVEGANNTVVVDVVGATDADTFNVEAFYGNVIPPYPPPMDMRIYRADAVTMPHSFNLNVTNWPAGTDTVYVYAWTESKNWNRTYAPLCVPETQEPLAKITYPKDGQRVHIAKTVMPPYNFVQLMAQLGSTSPFSASEIGYVDFEYSFNAVDWFLAGTDMGPSGSPSTWSIGWDNSDTSIFHDGDKVWLRANFYLASVPKGTASLYGTTPLVFVYLDATVPVVDLKVEPIVTVDGVDKISGPVDLFAYVMQSTIDIDTVYFYWKYSSAADIFFNYTFIDKVTPVNSGHPDSATIFAYRGFTGGSDQMSIDIRAIPRDAAGNFLFDYDGDMRFDDGWFALANPSDTTVFRDQDGPQPAIDTIWSIAQNGSDTITFINPSSQLGGNATIFAQAGRWIQAACHPLPFVDSAEVERVEWQIGTSNVGTRYNHPYKVIFWPPDVNMNYDALSGYASGKLTAKMYDKLGNINKNDSLMVYILDVTGNQCVVWMPINNSYNRADISLQARALNAAQDDIKSVTYQYGVEWTSVSKGTAETETTWYDIATVETQELLRKGSVITTLTWPYTWKTYNNDLNKDGVYGNDDGWYGLRCSSQDSSFNKAIGPAIWINITNNKPITYMIAPPDSSIVGPNLDIRDSGTDVVVQAVAKKYSPSSAGIDSVWFGYKLNINSSFTKFGLNPDSLTLYMDSIYTRLWRIGSGLSNGWYHLACETFDSAGNNSWTDTLNVFIDKSAPQGEIVTVNGDYNNHMKDITTPDTAQIVARIWDMPRDYNAGMDTIRFYIHGPDGYSYSSEMGVPLGPDPTDQYWFTWNHAGLPPGTYYIGIYMVDKVNNRSWASKEVPVVIRDITIPVGVVRAFHPYYLLASTMYQVDYLQFEYMSAERGGSDWIKLSLAQLVSGFSDLWWAPWDPMSLAGSVDMQYYVRAVPLRGEIIDKGVVTKFVALDNFLAPEVLITVTPDGEVIPEGTENMGPMSFMANSLGPVKGTATFDFANTTMDPYLIAMYSDLSDTIVDLEMIIPRKETGSDTYNGMFDASNITTMGGSARFYLSTYYDNSSWMEIAGFNIYKVTKDFGTNGWVWSMDETARITIPTGAVSSDTAANLLIYPAQAPYNPIINQKDLLPVGNPDGFIQHFYLYSNDGGSGEGGPTSGGDISIPSGIYSTIVMSYNEEDVVIDESKLQVARWTGTTYGWSFSGIRDLVVDTENDQVTFKTNQMGLFAVLQNVSGISIMAMIEVEPNCSDYSYKYPLFKATIKDNYSGVYASSIVMKVGKLGGYMMDIYDSTGLAEGFCYPCGYYDEYSGYDPSSGILKVEDCGQPFECATYVVKVSARNNYGVLATAVDTFTVDCAPPKLYIPKHYVSKNPEFWFTVEDLESGVDTNSIYIDFAGATDNNTYVFERRLYFTMTPSQIEIVNDTVYIDPLFEMKNDDYLHVVIYNGYYRTESQENESYVRVYPGESSGVYDCVGNPATAIHQWFPVDREAPLCSLLTSPNESPLRFLVYDGTWTVSKDRFTFNGEKSGIDSILILENGVPVSPSNYTFDPSTHILEYTPASGGVYVDLWVWDAVGNGYAYPQFYTIADNIPPVVTWISDDLYQKNDPTIEFTITDDMSGVDWDSVHVDVWKGDYIYKTFYPNDIKGMKYGDMVTIYMPDYSNNDDLRVVVYTYRNGTSSYPYTTYYYQTGPYDLAGNHASPADKIWKIDTSSPSVKTITLDERPIVIKVTDSGSGVDWCSLILKVDGYEGEDSPIDSTRYDEDKGLLYIYMPDGNYEMEMEIADNVGNWLVDQTFTTESEELAISDGGAYNWPNPFDPTNGYTTIELGNTKGADMTVKIYDFAGDLVKTVISNQYKSANGYVNWAGTTDDGEDVANGIYLCYIKAKATDGSKTAEKVIKIAVVKKD